MTVSLPKRFLLWNRRECTKIFREKNSFRKGESTRFRLSEKVGVFSARRKRSFHGWTTVATSRRKVRWGYPGSEANTWRRAPRAAAAAPYTCCRVLSKWSILNYCSLSFFSEYKILCMNPKCMYIWWWTLNNSRLFFNTAWQLVGPISSYPRPWPRRGGDAVAPIRRDGGRDTATIEIRKGGIKRLVTVDGRMVRQHDDNCRRRRWRRQQGGQFLEEERMTEGRKRKKES
jgi:hypothetical protein